jgi:hypothetical protein
MGFLDSEDDKAEAKALKERALERKEQAKKLKEIDAIKAAMESQNILAYEMGVIIKERPVFARWIKRQNNNKTNGFLVILFIMGAVIGFSIAKLMGA